LAVFGFLVPYFERLVARFPTPPYLHQSVKRLPLRSEPEGKKEVEESRQKRERYIPSPSHLSQDDISHQDNPAPCHREQVQRYVAAHCVLKKKQSSAHQSLKQLSF